MTDDTGQPSDHPTASEAKRANLYKSYLLRLWCEDEHGLLWRATLQCVTDPADRHSFCDLRSLLAYLRMTFEGDQGDSSSSNIKTQVPTHHFSEELKP